jgi:hypothetical protein
MKTTDDELEINRGELLLEFAEPLPRGLNLSATFPAGREALGFIFNI